MVSCSGLSDLGRIAYQPFDSAVVLNQVILSIRTRPQPSVIPSNSPSSLRCSTITEDDWEYLMKQTPARVPDLTPFVTALHLRPTIESVVEHNVARLHTSGQPVATIKAIHTGPNAAKASSEDAGGLQPCNHLPSTWSSCDADGQPLGGQRAC